MGVATQFDNDDVIIKMDDGSIDGKKVAAGQQTMANSLPVAIASNQSSIPVTQSGTWTVQPGNTANTTPWLATINQGGNNAAVSAANALKVDGSAVTQPISAAALPLPTGAATSALQTTGNSSLSSIDTKTPTLGQKTMANSSPVVIASDQSNIPVLTPDTAPATQTITALDSGVTPFTGANGQIFYIGTPTVSSAASFALSSIETISIQANLLGTGGTMVVEVSYDGGSFWFRPNVYQVSTQSYSNGFTAPFQAIVNVSDATNIRVRSTVSWSGTATIIIKESAKGRMVTVGDSLPAGSNLIGAVTISSSTLPTGAATSANQSTEIASLSSIDGKLTTTNASLATIDAGIPATLGQTTKSASMPVVLPSDQDFATGANQTSEITKLTSIDGKLTSLGIKTESTSMPVVEASDPTYSAGIVSFAFANAATDIFTISGSASKTVKVKYIEVSITYNPALGGNNTAEIQLLKRSTANSSGTSTTLTNVDHDSNDAAATAVVKAYTANPTLGSLVGIVRARKLTVHDVDSANDVMTEIWEFGNRSNSKPIVLRGTTESLCVNLNGNTLGTNLNAVSVEWNES